MGSWYTFAIIALFLMGVQRFLYKVSAEKRCNTAWTTFSFMATVAILSSILFGVLPYKLLVRGDIDAVDLVACYVTLKPLHLRPQFTEHSARRLRDRS